MFAGFVLAAKARANEQTASIKIQLAGGITEMSELLRNIATLHTETLAKLGDEPEYIGTVSELGASKFPLLMAAAEKADYVDNTLISYSADESFFQKIPRSNRLLLIDKVAQNRKVWNDLYSELSQQELQEQIMDLTRRHSSAVYKPKILERSFPVVNHVIFHGPDPKNSEVWFGFGLLNSDDDPVFRSTSPRLVTYFTEYFKALSASAVQVGRPTIADLVGAWLSVSYSGEEIGSPLCDCALASIQLAGGNIIVKGKVFETAYRNYDARQDFLSFMAAATCGDGGIVLHYMYGSPPGKDGIIGGARYIFSAGKVPATFDGVVFNELRRARTIQGFRLSGEDIIVVLGQKPNLLKSLLSQLIDQGCIELHKPPNHASPFVEQAFQARYSDH